MGKYIGEMGSKIVHMNRPAPGRCPEVDTIIDDTTKRTEPFDKLTEAKGYTICDKCVMD